MKVKGLLQIVSPDRTIWVEGQDELSIDVARPNDLMPETLEREIDFIYPWLSKNLGGINVIVVRVKEEQK